MHKKVNMTLVGLDGNAFVLLGTFKSKARRQGWTEEETTKVLDEAMSGDYDHLLQTLMEYTTTADENDE